MSQAFVREGEEQWLHEIMPTIGALIQYLTTQNNGIRVYEKQCYVNVKKNQEVHVMSNGLSYTKDENGRWMVVD